MATPDYTEFLETMVLELAPVGLLEDSLAAEIAGATWRLRRCAAAEAELPEFLADEASEKTRLAIERARSAAHSILHRSVNQLRRLQTERACREVLGAVGDDAGLIDYTRATKALASRENYKKATAENRRREFNEQMASICNDPGGFPDLSRESGDDAFAASAP